MLPFNIAEDTLAWPMSCIACGRSERPLVDAHRDIRLPGQPESSAFMHVYLCSRCVEWSMGVLGLDKRAELAETRREVDELTEQLGRETLKAREVSIDSLAARLEKLEAERQMRHALPVAARR